MSDDPCKLPTDCEGEVPPTISAIRAMGEPSLRQVAAEAVAEPRSGIWADDCLKPSLRQVAAEAVADDLRMPPTDGLDLKRLLEQFHAAQHLQSLAAQQQARDREDNERRHRQTQRVAWISLAVAVIGTAISVLI